ncbi:MAG TPA: hypothetical protein VFW25_08045 [Silvibacterium sp.]|nr:hypothetical protein [Silvibacterium sp.]
MKPALITVFFAVLFVSCDVLSAQEVDASEPQLHARPQAPNEQLLPASSVAPFVVSNPKKYPQKYAAVYMPVSLAAGRVRSPEFSVAKPQWYDIVLQVEKPLPFLRMVCMVGVASAIDKKDCEKDDPIIRADWTVWRDGRIVEWGSIPDYCACAFTDKNIFKLIGGFPLEAGKRYVVQVHFTKDGSPLNVANPHLIVIAHEDMW